MKQSFLYWIPALIWTGILMYFTLLPGKIVPSYLIQFSDLFLHWAMYLITFTAYYMAVKGSRFPFSISKKTMVIIALFCIALGGVLEIIQETLIPNRDGSLHDELANTAGILTAIVLISIHSKWKANRSLAH
jgi:hypothetical protein